MTELWALMGRNWDLSHGNITSPHGSTGSDTSNRTFWSALQSDARVDQWVSQNQKAEEISANTHDVGHLLPEGLHRHPTEVGFVG